MITTGEDGTSVTDADDDNTIHMLIPLTEGTKKKKKNKKYKDLNQYKCFRSSTGSTSSMVIIEWWEEEEEYQDW